jgi:FtsP/CotA-like multicopper oxidase with cupredoxin domain
MPQRHVRELRFVRGGAKEMRHRPKRTPGTTISRRNLLRAGLAGAALAGTGSVARRVVAAEEQVPSTKSRFPYVPRPNSPQYTLPIGPVTLNPDGKKNVDGIIVGGSYPGPEIRVREGDVVRLQVENHLTDQATTLHWHGLLVPAGMDGVPDVSNAPIPAQQFYVYEYPLRQSGTYWYHSHVGFQEQIGLAGPFVIEAKDEPSVAMPS